MGMTCETSRQTRTRCSIVLAAKLLCLSMLTLCLSTCATRRPEQRWDYPVPCIWPTPSGARVATSEFGETRRAGGSRHYRHQGIDISAPKGWPVYATADGIVCETDRDWGGYGKHVVIQHPNGYSTLYAHLAKARVSTGERVRAGQIIGEIGKTGRATGYHLHYEVRRDGRPLNPRPYLP